MEVNENWWRIKDGDVFQIDEEAQLQVDYTICRMEEAKRKTVWIYLPGRMVPSYAAHSTREVAIEFLMLDLEVQLNNLKEYLEDERRQVLETEQEINQLEEKLKNYENVN